MNLGRIGAVFAVAALTGAALVSGANAGQILTYTGNDFTDVRGSYTTTDHLVGTIDLASPLGDNLSLATVTPTSFSFSDGHQTLTQADTYNLEEFAFSTDSLGNITAWVVALEVGTNHGIASTDNVGGVKTVDGGGESIDNGGANLNDPGIWNRQVASVPEPLTLSLFGAGLAGAVAMRRRRKAKT